MPQDWLELVAEEVLDPQQRIVDPHHHLFEPGGRMAYGLDDLRADTIGGGHRVERTVFVEARAAYRTEGPDHLKPVGETEFVVREATRDPDHLIGGIVAFADLRDHEHLDEVLDAHTTAGQGLFRGIRHAGSHAIEPEVLTIPGRAPKGLYADPEFRRGVTHLGRRGLTYDTWHYHYQNREFADLARAVPDTQLVLDHFGTPLGVGRYYLHAIECFGPQRCMFESNFPVDRRSLSYRVLWNGLKKIAAPFSPSERDAMFRGTATRVYRLA
jgi:predicted TIM-barrel fold metal-dependent hydrolase